MAVSILPPPIQEPQGSQRWLEWFETIDQILANLAGFQNGQTTNSADLTYSGDNTFAGTSTFDGNVEFNGTLSGSTFGNLAVLDQVSAGEIGAGAVVSGKIGSLAISTGNIINGQVTNAKQGDMTPYTVKMRNNVAEGDAQDQTVSDLTEETSPAAGDMLLGWETGGAIRKFDVEGLPLADEGTTNAKLAHMAANTVKVRNAGTTGDPSDVTDSDLTEETTPATGDFLLGWDSSSNLRKFDVGDLPAGGGGGTDGYELIIASTSTNVASIDLDLTSSGWETLHIHLFNIIPLTNAAHLWMRMSDDSKATFESDLTDYLWRRTLNGASTGDATESHINLSPQFSDESGTPGDRGHFFIKVVNMNLSGYPSVLWEGGFVNSSATSRSVTGWGKMNDSTTYEALQFLMSTGNITASYEVYGSR